MGGAAGPAVELRGMPTAPASLKPLYITIELQCTDPLVYIYYVPKGQVSDPYSQRIDSLIVHTNATNGTLVGIELLDLTPATVAAATQAAADHGAVFPACIAAM